MKLLEYLIDGVKFIVLSAIPGEKDILKWELKELDKLIKERKAQQPHYDLEEVPVLIDEAKRKLRKALEKERCDLCKERIKEALEYLDEELEIVDRTHKIASALERLRARGVLPRDKRWEELSKEEKELVYREAGQKH